MSKKQLIVWGKGPYLVSNPVFSISLKSNPLPKGKQTTRTKPLLVKRSKYLQLGRV
jgi:hypothetical protein